MNPSLRFMHAAPAAVTHNCRCIWLKRCPLASAIAWCAKMAAETGSQQCTTVKSQLRQLSLAENGTWFSIFDQPSVKECITIPLLSPGVCSGPENLLASDKIPGRVWLVSGGQRGKPNITTNRLYNPIFSWANICLSWPPYRFLLVSSVAQVIVSPD